METGRADQFCVDCDTGRCCNDESTDEEEEESTFYGKQESNRLRNKG